MTPTGSAPAPSAGLIPGRGRPARLPRLRTVLLRGRLDAALAAGVDPDSDAALALRARQLTRPRHRRKLASSVERLVAEVDAAPAAHLSSAVPVRRDLVLEARETLLALAGALRDVEPIDATGVALTLRLITDPASPLYAGGALKRQAQSALEHLLAGTTWSRLPEAPPLTGIPGFDDHA